MDKKTPTKTPCINICKYNRNNFCVGCKRHSSEISSWQYYSDSMRDSIMKDLRDRIIDPEEAL